MKPNLIHRLHEEAKRRNTKMSRLLNWITERGLEFLESDEYMTIEEVAVLMRRDVKTIRNYMACKKLKLGKHYVKPGGTGHPLFIRVEILAFIRGDL